jgi:hypothetical protein
VKKGAAEAILSRFLLVGHVDWIRQAPPSGMYFQNLP